MSIPVSAMHETVKDAHMSAAEQMIEADPTYSHAVANRDAVRLAYILWNEAGNADLWDEAVTNYRGG
jgi:hypothetical protein